MNTEIKVQNRRYPRLADYRMVSPNGRSRMDSRGYNSALTEYRSETRVYFSHSGENVLEHLINRRARPTTIYRSFMGPVLEKLGLPLDTKYRWSAKAGCKMCPCSPGFIIEGDRESRDVWVTLSADAPKNTFECEAA